MDRKMLIEAALEARKHSYSPYSHYRVGAAILCSDGTIVTGANIENASYGATVCAERCAVFTAVASDKKDFTAIAICGGAGDEADDYAFPCGVCRQVLREFTDPASFKVIVAKNADDYREYTLEELLPESFGPDNLK
ncbi:MAG: cytidine deaminase [Lachnospiraceae bacterium]|nr:cytidine deaminase [Lachnospiraceae bacterium]